MTVEQPTLAGRRHHGARREPPSGPLRTSCRPPPVKARSANTRPPYTPATCASPVHRQTIASTLPSTPTVTSRCSPASRPPPRPGFWAGSPVGSRVRGARVEGDTDEGGGRRGVVGGPPRPRRPSGGRRWRQHRTASSRCFCCWGEPAFRDAARSRPLRWYRSAGGIPAQFGGAQRPGRCTRSHGHSAASQAATASASGTSSSAWLARTHDWTVTSASGDSEG